MAEHGSTLGGDCPTTEWSLIDRVREEGIEGARPYLAQLLTRYRPAMMAHLVTRMRLRADRAEETLQGFITDKIIEHGLISRADPLRGKFRHLVFTSLRRYVVSHLREEQAAKRHPAGADMLPLDDETDTEGEDGVSPELFDVEWARSALNEVLRRTQAECERSGQQQAWGMFDCRILRPLLHGQDACPYERLVERLGFESPGEASNALTTAKRIFDRMLHAVVREYADDAKDVEEEIRYLADVLAKSSAR